MLGEKKTLNSMGLIAVSIGKWYFRTRILREKRKSTSETTASKAMPMKQYPQDMIKALASILKSIVPLKSIKDLRYLV